MRTEIYTYDRFGVVTKHNNYITAYIKALYQAWILGVNSYVDYYDGQYVRTKVYFKGFLPFKFLCNNSQECGGGTR